MPDLDFVPMPRGAAAPTTTPTTFAPRVAAGTPRPVALARLDAPRAVDPAAHAAGFSAGYAAGARAAAVDAAEQRATLLAEHERAEQERTRRHAEAVAALSRAADGLRAVRAPVLVDALGTVHAAALELAVALLGAELSDASAAARAALARVLAADELPDDVTVRLHPRDAAALELPADVTVRVVADPALSPGDAVAEHADGYLDARLTAAVERARDALGAS